jgi:hypothetical protein
VNLRAWELLYDREHDSLTLAYLDIESMSEGVAVISGERVPASLLALSPEEAKARFIERVENGCRQLEHARDRAIAGLRANRGLLETAKKFSVLEAARLRMSDAE